MLDKRYTYIFDFHKIEEAMEDRFQ